jgi:hypothetical protein
LVVGVAQLASIAAWFSVTLTGWASLLGIRKASVEVVVGHDPQALPDLRRAVARSAAIDSPDGVTRAFQVSVNKVEPDQTVFARNLLAKENRRAALIDEMEPVRP